MLYIFLLLLRNSKCFFYFILESHLMCYCCCNVFHWKESIFVIQYRMTTVTAAKSEKKTQQYEKWRKKIWAHPKMLRRRRCRTTPPPALWNMCARERVRARLIFISEIYVYSMYLSVCFAYFFLLLSLCTLFKNKLPVFSAILAHTRSPTVLCFYCVELLIKWYFRNFHGQHSNMNCEYVRVHIEHITNSMWLNWLEYSYLFQDTHFTAQAVPANEHGLRCPYACFIEFHTHKFQFAMGFFFAARHAYGLRLEISILKIKSKINWRTDHLPSKHDKRKPIAKTAGKKWKRMCVEVGGRKTVYGWNFHANLHTIVLWIARFRSCVCIRARTRAPPHTIAM